MADIITLAMPTERSLRRITRLLDQADEAVDSDEWEFVASKARAVLALDADHADTLDLLRMATANGVTGEAATVPADDPGC